MLGQQRSGDTRHLVQFANPISRCPVLMMENSLNGRAPVSLCVYLHKRHDGAVHLHFLFVCLVKNDCRGIPSKD